ncbi:MAG: MBL fold metallo-hydrolase [Chloroflexi bacterium]|nr:MBL fold metallo-hydrolase [Chloroflexota bacterium]
MILRVIPVGPFIENVYIIGDEATKEGLIIDPGGEAERVLDEVQKLGLTVKYIVNTHGHADHTGAILPVKDGTGASFAIHERDVPTMQHVSQWVLEMMKDWSAPPAPDFTVKDGDVLKVGTLEFAIAETPGHTPGGLCVVGNGIAITGDTLFRLSVGRTDMPGGDWDRLLESIRTKLYTLPKETVVLPGHGPHSTIGDECRGNPFVRDKAADLWTPGRGGPH